MLLLFIYFLKDCGCSAEECDCAYMGLAREGICHAVPCGYELLRPPARGFVF